MLDKTIYIVHAADAEQHLGKLRATLTSLKEEKRIMGYRSLDSSSITDDSLRYIGKEDMVIVLLTSGIEADKTRIESILLEVKKQRRSKIVEILVDNVPYEHEFIALPIDLEPIRQREDMDAVWTDIERDLKNMFPMPEVQAAKPQLWKKFLPYILGAIGLLVIYLWVKPPPPIEFKIVYLKSSLSSPAKFEGECPHKFDFQGSIGANGPLKIEYLWEDSDGNSSETQTYEFKKADTIQITTSWEVESDGEDFKGWKRLKIVSPVEQESKKAEFNLQCNNTGASTTTTYPKPKKLMIKTTASVLGSKNLVGECPQTIRFTGDISVNEKTTVEYQWIRSDNTKTKIKTMDFAGSGTKSISTSWLLGFKNSNHTYDNVWSQLKIISPKEILSNKANFTLQCKAVQIEEEIPFKSDTEIEGNDVPFAVIEDVPIFPGCENESDKRACFQSMMRKHIEKNLRYPTIAKETGIQGRVSVMFTIQKNGSISEVRMRGSDENLEREAARIISKLPKMTPGKHRGRVVSVPYSIPITFKL